MDDASWRLFSDEELAHMCRSADERMDEALENPDVMVARTTYDQIEGAMRGFCSVYLDWLGLTDEYIYENHGHAAHAAALRPERTAEMAVRTGVSLDDLVIGQAIVAGPDNSLTAQMHSAIDAGASAVALGTWQEVKRILRDVHDLRRDLISDLLGWIYREYGLQGLVAAQEYSARRGWWRESMPRDLALDPKQRLSEALFMLIVGAFSEERVTEEEDRWVVHQIVCGNCGRQVRERYDDPSWGLETVKAQGPVTFGLPELTIYQTHLAVIHHMYAIDIVGAPWPSFECAGLGAGRESCRFYVYKDHSRTDPKFYEMVGRTAPWAATS